MNKTIRKLIHSGQEELVDAGIHDAAFDSKALLSFVMGIPFREIMQHLADETDSGTEAEFRSLIVRRRSGEPLQYITHEQEFMGFSFYVDERVLIPRLDTEILADAAAQYIKGKMSSGSGHVRILDLCCGSGAIGLSVAAIIRNDQSLSGGLSGLTLSDISSEALEVARINVEKLGLTDCASICRSDLFDDLEDSGGFDLIISNPPYVRTDVVGTLDREVRDHEPALALDGGPDGLDIYRRIIKDAPPHLIPGGCLMMEVGFDQADDITGLLEESSEFDGIEIRKDLAGLDRAAACRKKVDAPEPAVLI